MSRRYAEVDTLKPTPPTSKGLRPFYTPASHHHYHGVILAVVECLLANLHMNTKMTIQWGGVRRCACYCQPVTLLNSLEQVLCIYTR